MTTIRRLLAVPVVLAATASLAIAAEIRDEARLFSADAVRKATATLDRAERTYNVPVLIETVPSIGNLTIDQATIGRAKAAKARGVFVLIAKDEKKFDVVDYREILGNRNRRAAIRTAFTGPFKGGDYDAGLIGGSEEIASMVAEAKAAAATARPANRGAQPAGRGAPAAKGGGMPFLLTIGLIVLAVLIGMRVLGALFGAGRGGAGMAGPGGMGRPGMGYGGGMGGGMGGGGGGFFSSLLGGIGGAVAGNWMYDQFSGRNRGGDSYGTGDAGSTYSDPNAAGPAEYGEGGAGGWGDGGDAGGDYGGGGGGDWGGGGGGDWGGGGGDGGGGSW